MPGSEERRGYVLVVEDDDGARESLAALLQEAGLAVRSARDGAEAKRILMSDPHAYLIFLDLMMPRTSGWELVAELRRESDLSDAPIVLLSGVEDVHTQARLLEADGYLRKPVDPEMVVRVARGYARPLRAPRSPATGCSAS